MKRCCALLLFLIPCCCLGQSSPLTIAFCPLAALDGTSFPTIQGGLEWKVSGRISWYNEFGVEYMPSRYDLPDTVILRPHGIKAKTELRYHVAPGGYLAFNVFLTSDAHNTQVEYRANYDTTIRMDAFGVHKHVLGWNLVYGAEHHVSGRFWVDAYIGVGTRVREIRTVGERFDPAHDNLITGIDLNIPDSRAETDSKPGWSVVPNITMGVRVMYRFWKYVAPINRPHPRQR